MAMDVENVLLKELPTLMSTLHVTFQVLALYSAVLNYKTPVLSLVTLPPYPGLVYTAHFVCLGAKRPCWHVISRN